MKFPAIVAHASSWVMSRGHASTNQTFFASEAKTYLDGITHEQTIICRHLFAGHVVGCQPMKGRKIHRMIMIIIQHGGHTPADRPVYRGHLWYWTSMLWPIDTCKNKVSADQSQVIISRAQVESSSRSAWRKNVRSMRELRASTRPRNLEKWRLFNFLSQKSRYASAGILVRSNNYSTEITSCTCTLLVLQCSQHFLNYKNRFEVLVSLAAWKEIAFWSPLL